MAQFRYTRVGATLAYCSAIEPNVLYTLQKCACGAWHAFIFKDAQTRLEVCSALEFGALKQAVEQYHALSSNVRGLWTIAQ